MSNTGSNSGSEEPSDVQTGPHEVRITSHGKMTTWVDFALKFFEENPGRPLVFHTLPASPNPNPSSAEPSERSSVAESNVGNKKKADKIHPSTATIPRLVSVVEIIKREYVKMLDSALAEKGTLSGLHQYNELGELAVPSLSSSEDREGGEVDPERERLKNLSAMLQGKNHLKIKKIAYMKITLCRKELSHPLGKRTTYQKPSIRKLSKAARARAKKRLNKNALEQAQDEP